MQDPMMQSLRGRPRRTGPKRPNYGTTFLLAIGGLAVLGLAAELGGADSQSSVAAPATNAKVVAGSNTPVIAVLAGDGGPKWDAAALRAAAEPVLDGVVVTWHTGTDATELGALLGVVQLPAAAYLAPHCVPATCGATPVLPLSVGGEESTSPEDVVSWAAGTHLAGILFANDHPDATVRFWRRGGAAASGKAQYDLEPGGRKWIQTPLKSEWLATPLKDLRAQPWGRATVRGDTQLVIRRPGECNLLKDKDCQLALPEDEHWTDETLKQRRANTDRMLSDIKERRRTTPRFTPVGYEKRRAPAQLYSLLLDYYRRHNGSATEERWTPDNVYVNHEAARFQLVDLPETGSYKPTMYEMMRPIFETWAPGSAPLAPSAIYGIRIYSNGAILQDHSDRPQTHIISAIVNVAQDVDEPWPLEIVGHSGQVAHVTMQPGDMILYEGSSCAHGRPTPLKGRFMANVFIHMRPQNPPPPGNYPEVVDTA